MNNFRFYRNVDEYLAFVRGLFKSDMIRHPFYSGLVNWWIDNRTGMFFEASHDYEHAHFTEYFGLHLLRPDYKNPYIADLYLFHDMIHACFKQPIYPKSLSFEQFARLAITNEYVSSNDTDVLTYQRGDWRKQTFDFPIFYDLLQQAGWDKWEPQQLLGLRKSLVEDVDMWSLLGTHKSVEAVRKYMTRIGANWAWAALWYENMPYTFSTPQPYQALDYETYVEVLSNYSESRLSPSHYQRNMSKNVAFWTELVFPGKAMAVRFEEIPAILQELKGMVILPEVAKIFHQIVQSKAVTY